MFKALHNNFNVLDLSKSIAFYEKALGLKEQRRVVAPDKSFTLVFMGNEANAHQIELTWVADRKEKYDLGENEFHLAYEAEDFETAHKLHEDMGCICFENKKMGIYFISDPDGYWIEIIPKR